MLHKMIEGGWDIAPSRDLTTKDKIEESPIKPKKIVSRIDPEHCKIKNPV